MIRRFAGGLGQGLAVAAAVFIGVSATASDARAAEDFGPVKAMQFDAKKAALGKRLFFDKRLSGDFLTKGFLATF